MLPPPLCHDGLPPPVVSPGQPFVPQVAFVRCFVLAVSEVAVVSENQKGRPSQGSASRWQLTAQQADSCLVIRQDKDTSPRGSPSPRSQKSTLFINKTEVYPLIQRGKYRIGCLLGWQCGLLGYPVLLRVCGIHFRDAASLLRAMTCC